MAAPAATSSKKAVLPTVEDEDDTPFNSSNPSPRTLPGQAPNEPQYEKVRDNVSGRLVSNKPSNQPFLAYQKSKADRALKAQQASLKRQRPNPSSSTTSSAPTIQVWTIKSIFLALLFGLGFVGLMGNFMVESPVWGYEKALRRFWRDLWPRQLQTLTPLQLSRFNGQDPSKPIYLGIDGEVYDVSEGARMYGLGGSYNVFAGRDAARAFVTGCFKTHLTHDLRGFTEDDMNTLKNWKTFFSTSDKYPLIGHVINPPIDPSTPIPEPCRKPTAGGAGGELKRPPKGGLGGGTVRRGGGHPEL